MVFNILVLELTSTMTERFLTKEVVGFTLIVITFLPLPDVSLSVHQSLAELLELVSSAVHDSLPLIVSS